VPRKRYKRWDLPERGRRRRPRRLPKAAVAAAGLVAATAAVVLLIAWRLWFSPSGEAAPIEACAGSECQVQVSVAVDGRPLVEPLSVVVRADSAVEIDFVFRGLPVAPEEFRLLTPADRRWLVAEGTLEHPEMWPAQAGEGLTWVDGWDRAGNGRGLLRRPWRVEPDTPWVHLLPAAPALQLASGRYVVGGDALVTVTGGTPTGNYPLSIEAVGFAGGRSWTARAGLVISVLD